MIRDPALTDDERWGHIKAMRIHIRNFIICTDQGPDQKGAQAYIDHDVTSQLTCLVWRQWCFQHIGHLMVKRQLTCADSFFPQYFSGLAKFVNTWRGAQNAKKIAAVWKDRCPGTIDACRKLPPRPLRGRWGAVSACEKWLLDVKRREPAMPDIFEEALAPTLEQRPRANRLAQALQVETDCPEGDEAAHRAKVLLQ